MQTPPSSRLYTSIHKLPLAKFQDCLCDEDLTALIISGEPTDEELNAAWDAILEQYGEAIASPEQFHYIKLSGAIKRLLLKKEQVLLLVEVLRKAYVEKFARYLNRLLSTNFQFDVTKPAAYDALLDRCLTRTAAFDVEIEIKTLQLQALSAKSRGFNTKPSRAEFQKSLINLSDHAGRELDENTLTVFSYCERIRRYNAYVEQLQTSKK